MGRSQTLVLLLLGVILAAAPLACVATGQDVSPVGPTLTAAPAEQIPAIDGRVDRVWNKAPQLKAATDNGPTVYLKALYSKSDIYMLARWRDDTKDDIDEVWEFDGQNWRRGKDCDAISFFWDMHDSIPGFNTKGCQVLCHRSGDGSGRMTMEITGQVPKKGLWRYARYQGDVWDMSLGVSNVMNHVNDFTYSVEEAYLLSPKSFQTSKVYTQNDQFTHRGFARPNLVSIAQGIPRYRLKPGLTLANTPYPTMDQVEEITDYSVYKAGDKLPFMLFEPSSRWAGSRNDVSGKGTWQDGWWTVEFKRKLDTGHADDVRFAVGKGKTNYYVFGTALSNQTLSGHTPSKPIALALGGE